MTDLRRPTLYEGPVALGAKMVRMETRLSGNG